MNDQSVVQEEIDEGTSLAPSITQRLSKVSRIEIGALGNNSRLSKMLIKQIHGRKFSISRPTSTRHMNSSFSKHSLKEEGKINLDNSKDVSIVSDITKEDVEQFINKN